MFWFVKLLMWLRYRMTFKGLDALTAERLNRKGGALFLPNHPAEIDPILIIISLWRPFKPRPLVVEHFYYLKGVRFFMNLVRALPLPDFNGSSNKWKMKRVEKRFAEVAQRLREGENFLIYPSGKLKTTSEEAIGGASFVHNLVKECPEANIVLVRTTGLWGSRFSRGLTGRVPHFGAALLEGLKIVLKNGVFFTPRRRIMVEFEPAPADFPYESSRIELNRYLERWYNAVSDPLVLVSSAFWKEELPEVTASLEARGASSDVSIAPESENALLDKLAELSRKPREKIVRSMHLSHDLGLDSLDVAQLHLFLDERFDIESLPPGTLQTVDDLFRAAAGCRKEEEPEEERVEEQEWPQEQDRPPVCPPCGTTVHEAFLRVCDRMGKSAACGDAISGVLRYRRLKKAVLILRERIKLFPEAHIGVMLPASVAAYVVVLAVLLAKKVPVMINWTSGVRALDHAVKVADVRRVISSRRFLGRLENGEIGSLEDKVLLLEDVKESIDWKEWLRGVWFSFRKAPSLLKALGLETLCPEDPAVVLFTSGTETLPKGVPLSHHNLLSNQTAALACVDFQRDDVLYGVLPPFHSFGFSVTGILPLLAGLRVCYSPDPNDSHMLAREIATWKVSLFCCVPSFMRGLFAVASKEQLASMRLFVSGAERTPQGLFDAVASLGAGKQLLEGYGITECAPIVTLNRPGTPHRGVGQALPGVELCVVDTQSLEPVPQGEEGEVWISGPNVFAGYLGDRPAPFVCRAGKRWYRSGDRGYLDPEGHLILSGRLKRFVKIGGEMVSLGGIEEEILALMKEKGWASEGGEGPPLAVSSQEKEKDKPVIILYTTFDVNREEVNAALKERGYSRLVKIGEVRRMAHIPLTGTGKVHYRLLDERDETLSV
jgi:long-chain-fatty-acid--[acyl-carrier-protein] ligase